MKILGEFLEVSIFPHPLAFAKSINTNAHPKFSLAFPPSL